MTFTGSHLRAVTDADDDDDADDNAGCHSTVTRATLPIMGALWEELPEGKNRVLTPPGKSWNLLCKDADGKLQTQVPKYDIVLCK